MIKIIRDFVKPQFLALCDAPCLTHMLVMFQPGEPVEEAKQQADFAAVLLANGWSVTLARQICPAHVREEADARLLAMEVSPLKN